MKHLYAVLKKKGVVTTLETLIKNYPELGMRYFSFFKKKIELINEFLNSDENNNQIASFNEEFSIETLDIIEDWVNHKEFTKKDRDMQYIYSVLIKKGQFKAFDVLMRYYPQLGFKQFNSIKKNLELIENFLKKKNNNK